MLISVSLRCVIPALGSYVRRGWYVGQGLPYARGLPLGGVRPGYAEHQAEMKIVPGDRVVMARCDVCEAYDNPRESSGLKLGGRKGAYSGTCRACTGEG